MGNFLFPFDINYHEYPLNTPKKTVENGHFTSGLRLREQDRNRGFISEYAACAVTAGGYNHEPVPGAVILPDVVGKSSPALEAIRTLRHRWARSIEIGKWQRVEFAKHIRDGSRDELFLELRIGESGGIAAAVLKTVRPMIIGLALRTAAWRTKFTGACDRAIGIGVGVRRGVCNDIGDGYAEPVVHLVGHLIARDELPACGMAGKNDSF